MSSALCRKAWGTVLWYGKLGFGGRCLNKIFAVRTVLDRFTENFWYATIKIKS